MDSLKNKRIAFYGRFSSDNQRDTSIDDQLTLCRDFVGRHESEIPDNLVFTDYAISGRSLARADFDKLLRLIESRQLDVVVTESGDRLSRDLGDADKLWKLCEFHNVRVICVSDGIDSASDGSRLAFRFKAVMSDEYLVHLGKQTLRCLRGAAGRGEATGGRLYGYKTVPIWKGGKEPEGYNIEIDSEKAAVVVRIFEMYRSGHSLLTIAKALNDDGIKPPRFGSNAKKRRSIFWRRTTLREIIRNEAYTGVWTFGVKQWRKDPNTRQRRYMKRPATEVIRSERPHLRIISDELWNAVRSRCAQVSARYRGQPGGAPGRRTAHPFAGLLYCALCGHGMVDAGGGSSRHYRCVGAVNGGICTNRQSVREDALIPEALSELKRVLLTTSLHEKMKERLQERINALRGELAQEEGQLEEDVNRSRAEVNRILDFVKSFDAGSFPAALQNLQQSLERASRDLRHAEYRLEEVRRSGCDSVRVPTIEELSEIVLAVEARFRDDPTAAREALRSMLADGRLVMEPLPDGSYRARSVILSLRLPPKSRKPRGSKTSEASVASGVSGNDGCAGRI